MGEVKILSPQAESNTTNTDLDDETCNESLDIDAIGSVHLLTSMKFKLKFSAPVNCLRSGTRSTSEPNHTIHEQDQNIANRHHDCSMYDQLHSSSRLADLEV